ncbi:type II toxin-antitoxin system RelE/ParE family toxin [Micromonospora sp. URMC 107]|uniref:type II toxin-antitoxin system RelE/ParE family toxin n=1 Tax=Micromonospora sp. URMC 107 TaxID=3423418 RepID=UPI003F1B11E9
MSKLKELRPRSGRDAAVLFVFDPWSQAVLLVAGNKAGYWTRWYEEAIPVAGVAYNPLGDVLPHQLGSLPLTGCERRLPSYPEALRLQDGRSAPGRDHGSRMQYPPIALSARRPTPPCGSSSRPP